MSLTRRVGAGHHDDVNPTACSSFFLRGNRSSPLLYVVVLQLCCYLWAIWDGGGGCHFSCDQKARFIFDVYETINSFIRCSSVTLSKWQMCSSRGAGGSQRCSVACGVSVIPRQWFDDYSLCLGKRCLYCISFLNTGFATILTWSKEDTISVFVGLMTAWPELLCLHQVKRQLCKQDLSLSHMSSAGCGSG